ncbi:hypothetical protein BHYA_0150g00150 [Botrytis hyacinthi]|uniref:Prion-inhibition and propagation HeLo domain-containing protein n=1 Tax=Botrytis hyacinthi TaxID=278943 RepID=A0A4Z1GHI9_9HELO|nr:hypothetical protein BHYA_0150g00150 [Botrytis hyacinthi]
MTGVNKICSSCLIGHGTPDRCNPESEKLSNSAPSALNGSIVPRLAEDSTQSTSSTHDASVAKRESQGLVAPLREGAPWTFRYKKTEETLKNGSCEEIKKLGIGRPQRFDSLSDHFGCLETSNGSVAVSMDVDWKIDIHVTLQDITYEQEEEKALQNKLKISDLVVWYQMAKGKAEGGRGKLTTMQKCKWALQTAEDLQKLLNDIVLILDSLEKIIPCSNIIGNLVPIELDELSKFNSQSLEIVNRATAKCSVDFLLEQQLENLNPRRYAARAMVADNCVGAFARFHVGDTGKIDRGEKEPKPNPNGSDFIGNSVTGEGRMQVGDDYTGRSIWD